MTAPIEVDVASLGPLRQIGSGGQGKVFALVNAPNGGVYKEYSPRVVDDLDVDALHRFVQFGRSLTDADRGSLLARVAWPEVIVRRDGVVRGFLMPRIPPGFTVAMRFGDEVTRENALVQYLLNPRDYLAERGLRITDRFRLEFLRDTAETLALLHQFDIAVGDLSPNNLLFSLAVRPRCYFIDCDAMRLEGDSVLAQVETPDWQVSAAGHEELGTPASDTYKFGLLVVRLFAADQQARNPAPVPIRLRGRVVASLSAEPDKRVPPAAWLRPLDRLIDREPAFRPEPVQPAPAQVTDQEEPEQPVAAPAPPLPRPRRRWAWAGAVPVIIAVILGLANVIGGGGGGGAGSAGGAAIRPPVIPSFSNPVPTNFGLPSRFPVPTLPPLLPPVLPTARLPDLSCLLQLPNVAPDVRGGEGLTQAGAAVSRVLCDVNEAVRNETPPDGQVWQPLRDKAPYSRGTIVGFFGEGTASPTGTVQWTDQADGCWMSSVRFTATYDVASIGPLSACG